MPALPRGSYYQVWLVRADGTRIAAGTFRPTVPGGRARVRLAAGIPRPLVARVSVTLEGAGLPTCLTPPRDRPNSTGNRTQTLTVRRSPALNLGSPYAESVWCG